MKTLSTVSNISVALAVLLPMLGGCAEKAAGPTVTTGKPSVRESNAPPTREADTPPVHSSIPFSVSAAARFTVKSAVT